jgi:hypothetical protein
LHGPDHDLSDLVLSLARTNASGTGSARRTPVIRETLRRRRSRWSRLLTGSTVADQVLRAAGDLPVQVVNVGRPDKTSDEWRRPGHDARQHRTA